MAKLRLEPVGGGAGLGTSQPVAFALAFLGTGLIVLKGLPPALMLGVAVLLSVCPQIVLWLPFNLSTAPARSDGIVRARGDTLARPGQRTAPALNRPRQWADPPSPRL